MRVFDVEITPSFLDVTAPLNQENPIDHFVTKYLRERGTTHVFETSAGRRDLAGTEENDLRGRGRALRTWLGEDRQEASCAHGLLGEIVIRDMLTALIEQTNTSGIEVHLTPGSLDASTQINRGGDIVIVQRKDDQTLVPISLIDVTTAREETARRWKKPNMIHKTLGIPVIVLPLGDIPCWTETTSTTALPRSIHFAEYLRSYVRPSIQTGTYEPFVGFPLEQRELFQYTLIHTIMNGLTELHADTARAVFEEIPMCAA